MSPARARSASKSSAEIGLGAFAHAPTTAIPARADLAERFASLIDGTSVPTTIGPGPKLSRNTEQSSNSEAAAGAVSFSFGIVPTTTISRSP